MLRPENGSITKFLENKNGPAQMSRAVSIESANDKEP
jgi:hypothetical protein